jgi:hypothetical protein
MRTVGQTIAAALLAGLAFSGPAEALPSGENPHWRQSEAPPIVLAQRKLPSDVEQDLGIRPNSRNSDIGRRRDWRDSDRGRYRRYDNRWDRGYRSPPRGYRRYSSRPRDWQRRGCILIGPVWFCR